MESRTRQPPGRCTYGINHLVLKFFTRFSDTLTSDLDQTRPGLLVNTPMVSIWNSVRWSLLHRRNISRTDTYDTPASYSQFLLSYGSVVVVGNRTNIELNVFQYEDSENVAPPQAAIIPSMTFFKKWKHLHRVQKVWATTNFFIHRFNYQGFSYQLFY